jgi:hypothetical protein
MGTMGGGRASGFDLTLPRFVLPAKAGIQGPHERFVGFIWTPAFAGDAEV